MKIRICRSSPPKNIHREALQSVLPDLLKEHSLNIGTKSLVFIERIFVCNKYSSNT